MKLGLFKIIVNIFILPEACNVVSFLFIQFSRKRSLYGVNWVQKFYEVTWVGKYSKWNFSKRKNLNLGASSLHENNMCDNCSWFPVFRFPTPPPRNSLFVEEFLVVSGSLERRKQKETTWKSMVRSSC